MLDAVVVGAGQAGLGIGHLLQEAGKEIVIYERGRVGETWRSQRWDSFAVNTPNWANGLPGLPYDGDEPDGFWHRDELVEYFERYASRFRLPIREGIEVTSVRPTADGAFEVGAEGADGPVGPVTARNIVVASGIMQSPKIPRISERFPSGVLQLHAADYRTPGALPAGAVVVVGGGQSGCQITEDLLLAGRSVYVCTSRVGRAPRRHRGRDILEWFRDIGVWDETVADLPDPAMQFAPQPQVSGVGRYGSTLSLQYMQQQGAVLMGHLDDVVDGVLTTNDALAENLAFADDISAQLKTEIDDYIDRAGIEAPAHVPDPIDEPAGPGVVAAGATRLDLTDAGVSAVIWCTGFTATFDWLQFPVLDESGHPIHDRGVSPIPGIYFLGFPWLHTRKSGVILGIDEDARYLVDVMEARSVG